MSADTKKELTPNGLTTGENCKPQPLQLQPQKTSVNFMVGQAARNLRGKALE